MTPSRTDARAFLLVGLAASLPSCGAFDDGKPKSGDPLTFPDPGAGRSDAKSIRAVTDPNVPNHPAHHAQVEVTDAVVLLQDNFDEVGNGSSRGTIYVQDLGSQSAFSGISLFAPSFIPANQRVAPGDVLNLRGEYQENPNIGTAVFPAGQVLPQLSRPIANFRYEFRTPEPTVIDANDLKDYTVGRRWIGMLVTVKGVPLTGATTDRSNRVTYYLTDDTSRNAPRVSNELFDLKADAYPNGTTFTSITGIVTYFFNLKIAPRGVADLVQ
ncbi:MAG: hypothetical protein U0169_20130 [Polyangiaceae bacterium]